VGSLTSSFLLTRSRLADGRGRLGTLFAGASEGIELLDRREACALINNNFDGVNNFEVKLGWDRRGDRPRWRRNIN